MDLEVSTPISAEAEVKAYTLVGDDIYVKRYTNENIPTWYRQLISDIIATDNTITDLDAAVDYLSTLPAGYNQKITELQLADTTINTSLESLVTTTGSHTAAIANLDVTKVDATSAQAIARDTVGAYFADGSAGAWFNNQISTYASDISANAMNISTLSATLDGQSVRIDTVEEVNISQASAISALNTTINALSTDVGVSLSNLQSQIDGAISTYFYDYEPTLTNLPASSWTSDAVKLAHVGDLFYNRVTGYGYRFAYENLPNDIPDAGVIFSWIRITDVDVVAALSNASVAQATADGKRTVFYTNTTPVPKVENGVVIPIEIGDLWVNSDTKVTKVAVAVTPSVVWGDITNTATENALLSISVLEETNDGVVNTFYQASAPTTGMTYGDWWIDTDATPLKKAYRYQDANGKNVGTLSWVDSSNSILGNAMITSDAKSQIFYSGVAPTVTSQPLLDVGDQWVNTVDGLVKVWNGTAWVDVVAKSTAEVMQQLSDLEEARDGNVVVFYYTSTTMASGMTYGDYLVDTDSWDGTYYTVYRYENSVGGSTGILAWYVNTGDTARALSAGYRSQVLAGTAQSTADGKVKTWYQTTAPTLTASDIGDIWVDTDNANKLQVWSGTAWTDPTSAQGTQAYTWSANASKLITSPDGNITGWSFGDGTNTKSYFRIQADKFEVSNSTTGYTPFSIVGTDVVFNGKVSFNSVTDAPVINKTFVQTLAPTSGMVAGDTWLDSDGGYAVYTYSGSSWVAGGVKTYSQTAAPTSGMITGDLWIDTDDNNRVYRYNGTSWVDQTLTSGGIIKAINGTTNTTTIDGGKITTGTITSGHISADGIDANKLVWNSDDGIHKCSYLFYNNVNVVALINTGTLSVNTKLRPYNDNTSSFARSKSLSGEYLSTKTAQLLSIGGFVATDNLLTTVANITINIKLGSSIIVTDTRTIDINSSSTIQTFSSYIINAFGLSIKVLYRGYKYLIVSTYAHTTSITAYIYASSDGTESPAALLSNFTGNGELIFECIVNSYTNTSSGTIIPVQNAPINLIPFEIKRTTV